jgi:hypothetical protein
MESTETINVGRHQTFHVCASAEACTACGDDRSENWIVREDYMYRLAPETLCPECLSALRRDHLAKRTAAG